ncbi:MAG: plasmid replication protein, CyRepA1 family [Microcoleaceae cyanobacterium]
MKINQTHWDEWTIFNTHPRASEIASGLDTIPENWALTPVREKRPYRSNWQHEDPVNREAIAHNILLGQELISKKGKPYTAYDSGYGVRLGEISGGLLAIDVDGASAEPILKAISPELPLTVSWSSGKAGRYQLAFQIPPEYREQLANFTRAVIREWGEIKCDENELLEFRYNLCQSVLPPSYHPSTGKYIWVNSPDDTEVAYAPQSILDLLLELADKEVRVTREAEAKKAERAKYLEQRKAERKENPSLSTADSLADILELDILPRLQTEDIYNWSGHNFKKHGKKLVGFCPQHGGSSGTAFQVNPSDNSWYCHGCQEGGHGIQYRHFVNGGHGTPKGKDFIALVGELADDAGVTLPEWQPSSPKWVARRVDGIHKFANDIKKRITPVTPTEPTTISFCQKPTQQLANKLGETLIRCNENGDFLFNERGLLKILENHDKSIPLRLYPEVGYQGKPKLKQYFKLQSFLIQKGYELEIGWWEQWHKHSISIEDCLVDDIKYISWQEFKHNNRYSKLCYKESKKFTPTKEFSDRYLDGEAIAKMITPRSLTGINAPMGAGKTTSVAEMLKLHGTRDAFLKTLEKQIHQQKIHLKVAESELKNCTLFETSKLETLQAKVEKLRAELEETTKQLETEKTLSLISANKGAFLIAHRNNLLLQNKEKLGFLHLRFDEAYHKAYDPKSWLAFCIDSICKLDYECLENRIVFLDEISNLIPHFLAGSTCRKFRREILDKFVYLLKHAHAVVIMDANLKDWEFNYIKELGNFDNCNKLANLYQKQPLNITFYEGTIDEKGIIRTNDFETLIQQILTDYGLGETLIIPCDSQKKCEYLHEYLGGKENPEIIRIDSSTITLEHASAFISAPNEELKKKGYKVLIYSPSMDSGVSIELIDYFTKGYSINTVLGAEAFSQLPGRLRDNIPWVHWSKTFIAKNDELAHTDPTKVEENIRANAYDDMALAMEKIEEGKQLIREGHQLLERSNDIHLATYCKVEAQENYEHKNLRETYYEKLLEDGHNITKILVPKLDKSAQWQQAKEDVVKRNSEQIFYAEDINLIEAEKIFQELNANIDKQRAAKKAMLTKVRLPGLTDTEIWHPALLAFLDYSDRNCISRLELRHLLNNPELELCRQSAWYHNLNLGANNGKIMLQDFRSPQLKARMLRDIGLLDFLDSPNRFYDGDSPEIQALIRRANHWRRQKYLGRRGNIPAMKYVNKILARVGYKFVAKKHNGKRMYRIADMYEEINVAVYDQKLKLTKALTPIIASKYESQLEKAESYIQEVTQVGTEQPNISIQVCYVPKSESYREPNVGIKITNPLDLYQPPPDTPLGDLTIYENDLLDFAGDLEILIALPPVQQPDLTPLEAFKYKVQTFGWNVIKEAAKHSEALADKVISFVEQLIDSGEWHFAPG